ncbi:MAG: FtsX-like permease family protein [Thiocapsa sp.]|uniref:ABC transporter permease n=1 Tax=Thiocapsa sp. TaxID=2024551 RepID=UPI001BD10EFF|nr:FtsX-like permease family protein [Thiocapsa sp.]QVL50257.1 MAG: FtsX-like permease family protein [Thiocapsa sp.]
MTRRKQMAPPTGTIFRLAWLDLRHEWILSLCMVLAIAAVLGPLLILMGLKYGTIQTLRDRLVEDPVNREIRPLQTEQLTPKWFAELLGRSDVGFAIPTILRGSSIARVDSPKRKSLTIDLIPTADGDPLLLENGGAIPGKEQCVLSLPAAEELKVEVGEHLRMTVSRTRNGERELEMSDLEVIAVLSARADALPRLYAPLDLVEDIEAYREGLAVPARGWPGGPAKPFTSFDGIRIVTEQPLDGLTLRGLGINTGLVDIDTLDASSFALAMGFSLPAGVSAYEFRARGNTIQDSSLSVIKSRLRGKVFVLLPFADDLVLELAGHPITAVGLSLSDDERRFLGLADLPWGGYRNEWTDAEVRQIILPNTLTESKEVLASVPILNGERLEFPLRSAVSDGYRFAIIPTELAGILRTGVTRRLEFKPDLGGLILARSGHRGFRLYARGIDDVPSLYRWFIDQNISVQTMAQEIERVQILDRGLTRIFWLVAAVGILGGMASLVANLYAAVERKKRDISVLRLMGLSRIQVFRFPVYQGQIMAVISVMGAIVGYFVLAGIINHVFSADLQLGQKICSLPMFYFATTLLITVAIAFLSSLLAAWKTTQIDPAEALREE